MCMEIVSASAGTGKTYHLAEERLPELILEHGVQPDRILATTFTKKAADELVSRIRRRLLAEGQTEQARALTLARIGTVNSVCDELVRDFAFELGLSPDLQVLDDDVAKRMLHRILDDVIASQEQEELAELAERMSGLVETPGAKERFEWRKAVMDLLSGARASSVDAETLRSFICASQSALADTCFGDDEIPDLSQRLLDSIDQVGLGNVGNQALKRHLESVRNTIAAGRLPKWSEWQRIAKDAKAKTYAPIRLVAELYPCHPRLREDMRRQMALVYDIAARALAAYQEEKQRQGLIDFTDQEVYLLRLLELPDLRTRLGQAFDLIMVDEFQDTSPLELAIFLRLRQLCPRCIWVGDQKQSIYGFRDADPALMKSVLDAMQGASVPVHTLNESWRSRPGLVAFCSELFAPVFLARMDMEEDLTRIEAAEPLRNEPDGLGPVLERWTVGGRNAKARSDGLADCVAQFLADDSVNVRGSSQEPDVRRVGPGDLAILCRQNRACREVAGALQRRGIPVSVATPGLLKTPEARLVVAGLRIWASGWDSLAGAEISRLTAPPEEEEAWFGRLLTDQGTETSGDADRDEPPVSIVDRIRDRARQRPGLGLAAVFQETLTLLGFPERLPPWGDLTQRMSNIGALRAHMERFISQSEGLAQPVTTTGFVLYIEELAKAEEDTGGLRAKNAVTVSTWHGAKGLEWPVVIGWELDTAIKGGSFGVHAISPEALDLDDPLANRELRYWPDPLSSNTKNAVLYDRAQDDTVHWHHAELDEALRLLYVVMTRARDRFVFAGSESLLTKTAEKHLEALVSDGDFPLTAQAEAGTVSVRGEHVFECLMREARSDAVTGREEVASAWYSVDPERASLTHPPAVIQPSRAEGRGTIGAEHTLHERMSVTGAPNMEHVGNAVHGFLAADIDALPEAERRQCAERLLANWAVADHLCVDALLAASTSLRTWIEERWPGAGIQREAPVMHRRSDGSLVSGTVDLLIQTPDSLIIVDHKTFPGTIREARERAATRYAGQLQIYSEAMETALGIPARQAFVHFPVIGLVVEVVCEV
jgi:ATP-dependent helicase/nuclease subunit A